MCTRSQGLESDGSAIRGTPSCASATCCTVSASPSERQRRNVASGACSTLAKRWRARREDAASFRSHAVSELRSGLIGAHSAPGPRWLCTLSCLPSRCCATSPSERERASLRWVCKPLGARERLRSPLALLSGENDDERLRWNVRCVSLDGHTRKCRPSTQRAHARSTAVARSRGTPKLVPSHATSTTHADAAAEPSNSGAAIEARFVSPEPHVRRCTDDYICGGDSRFLTIKTRRNFLYYCIAMNL